MKDIEDTTEEPKSTYFVQWIATFSVFQLALQMGIGIGWASPNSARLLSGDSPISATTSDVSWMASILAIGSGVGSILGALSMEYTGSRRTILMTHVLIGVSWVCVLVANSVEWLFVSRFIFGIGCASFFCCFSIYLGEISDARIRGSLISLSIIGSPVGVVLGIIAETYLPMTTITPVYLVFIVVGILLFFWLHDTPYFLIKKKRNKAATKSFIFYNNTYSEKEFDAIVDFAENSESLQEKLNKLKLPVVKKSLFIIMLVFALPHLGGYGNIMTYMEIIFKSAKLELIKPEELVIYANIITVISAFLTFNLIDKLGRKVLLIISSVGTAVALVALGIHFYLLKLDFDAESLQWLPVSSVLLYLITYPIGYGTVPGALLSELFPENIKSIAVCAATFSVAIFGFAVAKIYQPVIDYAGESYAFWMHAVLSFSGVPSALFLIIETKGKTFQEIQDKLDKAR